MKTEYTKTEWREVARLSKPTMTDAQYDIKWGEFQDLKAKGLLGVRVG